MQHDATPHTHAGTLSFHGGMKVLEGSTTVLCTDGDVSINEGLYFLCQTNMSRLWWCNGSKSSPQSLLMRWSNYCCVNERHASMPTGNIFNGLVCLEWSPHRFHLNNPWSRELVENSSSNVLLSTTIHIHYKREQYHTLLCCIMSVIS
jgi:hypothetical protein